MSANKLHGFPQKVRPTSGTMAQGRDRFAKLQASGANTVDVEWPEGAEISELSFFVVPAIGETLNDSCYVIMAVEPLNTAQRDIALTTPQLERLTNDVQWKSIPVGNSSRSMSDFLSEGSMNGGKISLKTVGTCALDVAVEAN